MIKPNPRPALEALGIATMVQILVACGLFLMWGVVVMKVFQATT